MATEITSLFHFLFNDLPPIWRWIFTIITGGIFWLARKIWINHQNRVTRLEMTMKTEIHSIKKDISDLNKELNLKFNKILFHLLDSKKDD